MKLARRNDGLAYAWPWVYFHGLEGFVDFNSPVAEWSAPDLVESDTSKPTEEGVYSGTVYGMPCTIYLWGGRHGEMQGLVVNADHDKEAAQDAWVKFTTKQENI